MLEGTKWQRREKKILHLLQSRCVRSNLTTHSLWKLFVEDKSRNSNIIITFTSSNCNIRWWRSVDRPLHTLARNTWDTGVEYFSFMIFIVYFFSLGPWSQPCWGPLEGRREQQDSPESEPRGPGVWPYGHHFHYPLHCMVVFMVIEFFTISFFLVKSNIILPSKMGTISGFQFTSGVLQK